MHAALSELNRKANTFAIQFEYSLQLFTSRGHSAHVLNLFAMQHERVLQRAQFKQKQRKVNMRRMNCKWLRMSNIS